MNLNISHFDQKIDGGNHRLKDIRCGYIHQSIVRRFPVFRLSQESMKRILKTTAIQGHFKEFATTHANGVDKPFLLLFNDKAMQSLGALVFMFHFVLHKPANRLGRPHLQSHHLAPQYHHAYFPIYHGVRALILGWISICP